MLDAKLPTTGHNTCNDQVYQELNQPVDRPTCYDPHLKNENYNEEFIQMNKKENEIIILRAENSNLKTGIANMEKNLEKFKIKNKKMEKNIQKNENLIEK